ncbi:MAG: VanZ family protein [Desulfobacterales bacterium]|jgi:VanZ family protein
MPTQSKNFIFYWLPLILYCLLIFIQSSKPSFEHLPDIQYFDKILHFVVYAILGILFFRAFHTMRLRQSRQLLILLSILGATLYGISDEIHQYYVPFRDADVFDVIANTLGSVFGVYIYSLRINKKMNIEH